VPDIAEMGRQALKTHCEMVWESTNDVNPAAAKTCKERDSGFWTAGFQIKWIKKQCDRIHDHASC
jgi:hypothetical protein